MTDNSLFAKVNIKMILFLYYGQPEKILQKASRTFTRELKLK